MQDLEITAIQAALCHNWEKAIEINLEMLKSKSEDTDAMNRLAYAYCKIGKLDESMKIYRKVLLLDKYNIIAQKNLEKLCSRGKSHKTTPPSKQTSTALSPSLFIEEPGRTKTVSLAHVAPANVISKLDVGDPVLLYPKKHSIDIRSLDKTYLGALPDDIAFRLLRFIKAGNTYDICIKHATKNSIAVFIREMKRGKRFSTQPSFITTSSLHTYAGTKDSKVQQNDEDDDAKTSQEDEV